MNYWTHRDALDNKELPASLAIVGGGVIGMEFASFFNSLGVQVTVVEMLDEILGGMDKELSALLRAEYAKRGIKFLLSTKVVGLSQTEGGAVVSYENAEGSGNVVAEKAVDECRPSSCDKRFRARKPEFGKDRTWGCQSG